MDDHAAAMCPQEIAIFIDDAKPTCFTDSFQINLHLNQTGFTMF